jgi:hypothetical protein
VIDESEVGTIGADDLAVDDQLELALTLESADASALLKELQFALDLSLAPGVKGDAVDDGSLGAELVAALWLGDCGKVFLAAQGFGHAGLLR